MKQRSFVLELKRRILPKSYNQKRLERPPKLSVFLLIAKLFTEKIIRIYQKILFLDQWYLMFDLSKPQSMSFHKFRKIIPPKDRFWADPHAIQLNGHYFVFVEEYIYKNRKGHISVIEIDKQGNYKDPVKVLEKEYHLSYPFVFQCDGRYYMLPESAGNKTVELYECLEFPNTWKLKMNLMENVNAVDTTLFYYRGKWWLFAGMQEDEAPLPLAKLYLFFSSRLFTRDWTPHPLNPIEPDVTKARPAGKLFLKDGKIIRPSQNCSKAYGYGFYLNEVLRLSEDEYSEKTVASVRPDWDRKILGTHTYAGEGQLTLIDAFTRRRRVF
jgi:hypothetical protein